MSLVDEIKKRLEAKGLSPRKASIDAGLSETFIKSIYAGSSPSVGNLTKLAAYLGCTIGQLVGEDPTTRMGEPARIADVPAPPAPSSMDKDVPVFGTAQGGPNGSFEMNTGDTIDYVRRPPGIARTADVYAIYLEGESMMPALRPGTLLYVHAKRPPGIGSDVVIQMKSARDGDPVKCFVKRLVAINGHRIICEQFNPPEQFEIPRETILHVHRILTIEEMMGV